ncbi:MAG TPA: helix-turn-helix transcriptional regulator [Anaerolineae bacterium]
MALHDTLDEAAVALLRQLVLLLPDASPVSQKIAPAETDQLVLSIEIDDHCYHLMRTARPTHNTVHLSPREQEIVHLVVAGLSNRAIAQRLEISAHTVSSHLRRVFGKLQVHSRAEMVGAVLTQGLLDTTVTGE